MENQRFKFSDGSQHEYLFMAFLLLSSMVLIFMLDHLLNVIMLKTTIPTATPLTSQRFATNQEYPWLENAVLTY